MAFIGSSWNIGFLALAIYLIIVGLSIVAGLAIPPMVTGILPLIAGFFFSLAVNKSSTFRL